MTTTTNKHASHPLEKAEGVFAKRKIVLEDLRKKISPKFFTELEEKIAEEEGAFARLAERETKKQEHLATYSLPLPSQFFDQQFLDDPTAHL